MANVRITPPTRSDARQTETTQADAFVVQTDTFTGSLAELAEALRRGDVLPSDVRGLALVRDYLGYYRRLAAADLDLASETLPVLARVLELKARLLLPSPPRSDNSSDDSNDVDPDFDVTDVVDELAALENAITFLRERRAERRLLLPASAPRPSYPRPPRPHKVTPSRLAELAGRYRPGRYFELARERFTLAAATEQLRTLLHKLGRTTLFWITRDHDWGRQAMFFTGMLELVKEGDVEAEQLEPYADITLQPSVSLHRAERRKDAHNTPKTPSEEP